MSVGLDESDLQIFSRSGGLALDLPVSDRIGLYAFGMGGYFYASIGEETGTNPCFGGGVGLYSRIGRQLRVGVEVSYFYDLYNGAGVGLVFAYGGSESTATGRSVPERPQLLGGGRVAGEGLEVNNVALVDIFSATTMNRR